MKSKQLFLCICTIILSAAINGSNAGAEHPYLKQHSTKDSGYIDKILLKNTAIEIIAYVIQDHLPPNEITEIFLINSDGTGKTQLTNQPARRPYDPAFSPDGSQIAHYTHINHTTWSLWIMNADGSNIRRLTSSSNTLDWMPRWSPDGQTILFTRSFIIPTWRSEIWTIKPDGTNAKRIGSMDGEGGDYSPDGSKIVFSTYFEGGGDIWIMNADGTNPLQLTTNPSEDWHPRFSPDGSKIAFASMRDGNFEIYVMYSDGSNPVRLTNNPAEDINVDWSSDGSRIAFVSERDGHSEIYIMNADGTNQTRLTHTSGRAINPDWKPAKDPTLIEDIKKSSNSFPGQFQLFQNYPNPFNPATNIRFDILAPTHVRLQVFNIPGSLVTTLLDEVKAAGSYSITWNGTDESGHLLPAGLYFYRLQNGNSYQMRKALLVK